MANQTEIDGAGRVEEALGHSERRTGCHRRDNDNGRHLRGVRGGIDRPALFNDHGRQTVRARVARAEGKDKGGIKRWEEERN